MAKEFKDYDKKYAKYQCTILAEEPVTEEELQREALMMTHWPYRVASTWGPTTIRHAVYLALSAEEWQKFRVSMKGMNTHQKLYRLKKRYDTRVLNAVAKTIEWDYERCRIDNYIGALVRGGKLNRQLEIVA